VVRGRGTHSSEATGCTSMDARMHQHGGVSMEGSTPWFLWMHQHGGASMEGSTPWFLWISEWQEGTRVERKVAGRDKGGRKRAAGTDKGGRKGGMMRRRGHIRGAAHPYSRHGWTDGRLRRPTDGEALGRSPRASATSSRE